MKCVKGMAWIGALVVALGLASNASAAEEGWLVDYKAAMEKAAKEGKDIFMEFTGSDWCPPCINLKKTVLDSEVFKTQMPESYILLKLDNPRDKSKQSPEEIEQYKKLSAEFKVTGVPTVILLDAKGRPFAKNVGYGGQPAEVYVKDIVAKVDVRKTRDENFAKAEKAEGIDKAKLLDQAIAGLETEMAVAQYKDTVEEIIKLDEENSAGLKTKYEGVLNSVVIKSELQAIMRTAQPNNLDDVFAKLDALVEEKKPQGQGLQEVLFMKAQLLFRGDKAKSKETLLAAQKAAPETPVAKQIDEILKRFFADDEDAAKKVESKKDEAKKSGDK